LPGRRLGCSPIIGKVTSAHRAERGRAGPDLFRDHCRRIVAETA